MARAAIELCRPRQALSKNLIVFAALLFSGEFLTRTLALQALGAFISFMCLSSSVYAFNDLVDVHQDRQHPLKKKRPVASERISLMQAAVISFFLSLLGLGLAYYLSWQVAVVASVYLCLQLAYSFWLKHQVILDVFIIAAGFVLRAVAGAVAIRVMISPWLLLCTSLLALFLGLAKRRHELTLLAEGASQHRKILNEYSAPLLDQMIAVVSSATVLAYALYTVESHPWHGFPVMMVTIPFVLYGIFRYLYLIHQKGQGGRPEMILLQDVWIRGNVLIWVLLSVAILYLVKVGGA